MAESENCYDVPEYWDLAFSDDTILEAEFVISAAKKYCDFPLKSLYEPGCGGGRLVRELARRGYDVTGTDLSNAAISFASQRLAKDGLAANLLTSDMREPVNAGPFDVAYCFVNTFRHLLTEEDAVSQLNSVASVLRSGGLYIIGLHLLPPDADEEDEEDWSVRDQDVEVHMQLVVAECDRKSRQETLRFTMTAEIQGRDQPLTYSSDYRMRTYEAGHMKSLLESVPALRLLDVYDFWYDIDEPLVLSDELADTVFVMQKR